MKKPHWTDEDIDLLKRYYETRSKEEVVKLFPERSWSSLRHKAERLKVYRASVKHYLRPKRIGELQHDDKVYVAAITDGEGMITVSVKKNRADPHKGGSPLTPLIGISNSKKELIDWLHSILFGSTIKTGKEDIQRNRKAVWAVQVARLLDVKCLLEQILPYLKVKRRQAELVLEFCNVRLEDSWATYNPRLFEIAKEVRKLNRKGLQST